MSFIANGNDVCKKEWQIVEISPTKKYFCKKSKSLKTKKEHKQNINPDQPEGIKTQQAEAVFNQISGQRNKNYPGLISLLQGFQKCIA